LDWCRAVDASTSESRPGIRGIAPGEKPIRLGRVVAGEPGVPLRNIREPPHRRFDFRQASNLHPSFDAIANTGSTRRSSVVVSNRPAAGLIARRR